MREKEKESEGSGIGATKAKNWKRKRERERHCSPQMEDKLFRERKDSLRLLSLPFMRAGPLILHGSCQDPTEMHRRNLHTRSSGISSTRLPFVLPRLLSLHFSSAIHLTSLGCTTCFSSSFFFFFSFFDAIATLLCTDRALFVSSSLHLNSRRSLSLWSQGTLRGGPSGFERCTNRSHSPHETMETVVSFELPIQTNIAVRDDLDDRYSYNKKWSGRERPRYRANHSDGSCAEKLPPLPRVTDINSADRLGELASSPCNRGRAHDKFASILRLRRYEY